MVDERSNRKFLVHEIERLQQVIRDQEIEIAKLRNIGSQPKENVVLDIPKQSRKPSKSDAGSIEGSKVG